MAMNNMAMNGLRKAGQMMMMAGGEMMACAEEPSMPKAKPVKKAATLTAKTPPKPRKAKGGGGMTGHSGM